MLVEVNKVDYLNFSGIDLDLEIKGANYDVNTNVCELVIGRIQDQMVLELKRHYGFTGKLNSTQREAFKRATLHQIDYIRANGELSINCENQWKTLSPNAYAELKSVGLCNLTGFMI